MTIPDLTPEGIERMARKVENLQAEVNLSSEMLVLDTAATLRALLDAKEAAERERDEACAAIAASAMNVRQQAYDIALNSGNTNRTIAAIISGITIHDTEALRAVKEAVWAEGWRAGEMFGSTDARSDEPNPYAKKDTT